MSPTNEQIITEAERRWDAEQGTPRQSVIGHAIEIVRENWTPPEPEADPDVLAFREWFRGQAPNTESILTGEWDQTFNAVAYLAGARMAREQEQERAKWLEDRFSDLVERVTLDGKRDCVTGVNAGEMISARVALAKYRGEA